MQHAQSSHSKSAKSALLDKRVIYPLRHPVTQNDVNSSAQRSATRRKPVRLLRAARTDQQQLKSPLQVLTDASTARGSEARLGAAYEAQEEAARRIAQRLHDESAQMLATIYLQLAAISRDCPDGTVRKIDLVVKQLDGVREQLRGMSHELSPPILDQLGLMPALQSLANGVRQRSGLKLLVTGSISDLPHLVGAVLYRVVQEALSNVVRHAKATEATVTLFIKNNKVVCTVCDNGIGFRSAVQHRDAPVESGKGAVAIPEEATGHGLVLGLGLVGIHERVTALKGRCQISSGEKGGTQLQVEIPL